jgi:hypothetical protein
MNFNRNYFSLFILFLQFIINFTVFGIDRVATFPVIEKASADNGLAVNPIQRGSSRAYGGLSTSSPSITFMSSSTYTNMSYTGSGTAFLLGYDTKLENGYIGVALSDVQSTADYSYYYSGYRYNYEYQTKLTSLLVNGASEISDDFWLGGYLAQTSSKEDDSLKVSTYSFSSTASNSVFQMGVFGNTSVASEVRAGWRVSPASSSKANYSGNLWPSSTKTRMGNGLTLTAGIGIQEKVYATEFVYYNQSEEKDAGQGNESGFAGIYERDLGEVGIGLEYSQISTSELKDGNTTFLGSEQTHINIEGAIKIDDSLNGRIKLQKIKSKPKNSTSIVESEATVIDIRITGSFF